MIENRRVLVLSSKMGEKDAVCVLNQKGTERLLASDFLHVPVITMLPTCLYQLSEDIG